MTDTICYSRTGHVGRILLNHPSRHNALGREQLQAIQAQLTQVAADPQVRVLIVTGAGDKTFCAGASLQELDEGLLGDDAFQKMTEQLAAMVIPTICAMNGNAFGGGVELAASCDFRIAVDGCRVRVPAAEIGLCYPLSGMTRFVECLGLVAAKRLLVAAEDFDADSLARIGFLDHVVVRQQLDEFVLGFAHRIALLAPLAVQSMKRILGQLAAGAVDFALARDLSDLCRDSDDLKEGLAAKREKRSPSFQGR